MVDSSMVVDASDDHLKHVQAKGQTMAAHDKRHSQGSSSDFAHTLGMTFLCPEHCSEDRLLLTRT